MFLRLTSLLLLRARDEVNCYDSSFLAGGEVEQLTRALLDQGVKRVLYSYWYILQMRRETFIAKMQDEYPEVSFILDSGAFTYWAKYKNEPEKLMGWREFRRNYFDYIDGTWERWARVAELDLDNTFAEITLDRLADWRDEMYERCPEANLMPVWHGNRGPEEWDSYIRDRRWKYLAIGSGQRLMGMIRGMIWKAHQWRRPVHGFGMTRVNTVLGLVNYDSVDSSSWLSGQKYGTLFCFRENKFSLVMKDRRSQFRKHLENIGIDWKKLEDGDISELRKANILAWKRVGERLEEMRKRQGRSLQDLEPTAYDAEGEERLNHSFPWHSPLQREQASKMVSRQRPQEQIVYVTAKPREGFNEYKGPKDRGAPEGDSGSPRRRDEATIPTDNAKSE